MKLPLHRLSTAGAAVGYVPKFNGTDYVPAAITTATIWTPLTTVVGGTPDLVWDSNDELVLIEVPTP